MLNIVALMGRITADPELKTTPNGVNVCQFSIAVERSFCKAGEQRKADFINIVAWRQAAEFVCKYFRKGSMICVDGSVQTRNYEDKSGNKRTAFEVVANNLNFTGEKAPPKADGKLAAIADNIGYAPAAGDDFAVIDDNEDLPF